MPAPDRLTVLRTILEDGAVPTFTAPDAATAFEMVAGCAAGGSRVVEFTNRGAAALETFGALARRVAAELPELILGAGTIIDAPTGALFIASGARFVVGQSFSEEVARLCNRRRIAYIPGCGTATEIATSGGARLRDRQALPGGGLRRAGLRPQPLAPSPGSKVMPTNVLATEEATRAWLVAGAACLGVAGPPLPGDLIASRDREEIARRTRTFLGWVGGARAGDARATGS